MKIQNSKFKMFLQTNWPVVGTIVLVLLMSGINYTPGTFLTGWDNLHPEFSFWINIKRSIFAVWQEYQGTGLLGGMGHASDLPHQLFLLFLSIFVPVSLLRYIWTFLMLLVGGLGMLLLLKKLFYASEDSPESRVATFAGAAFYILNLSTIQMFYAPFESFINHFAALPWLLLTSVLAFRNSSRRNLLWFALVLFLTTPHAYIPTLFTVYMISLSLLMLVIFLHRPSVHLVMNAVKLFAIIIIINAYWLFPFAYFTLTNSQVNLQAKINQMATETIILQNKEFGDLGDVMLLKGFWFNNIDPDLHNNFSWMLLPWRNHLDNPFVVLVGYLFFAVIIRGVIMAFRRKNSVFTAFCMLFVFAFTMLATATPPFSYIDILFRKVPLFEQAFRFPFTKFSILTAFTYSIFFSFGIYSLIHLFQKAVPNLLGRNHVFQTITHKHIHASVVCLITVVYLVLFAFPVFQGNLFYAKERIPIPQEYFDLFQFFNSQDHSTRIANFPQHTFWGWSFYNWKYGGSGFLWYGIPQPILDRAFDVWSETSENYYFEISNALYTKNQQMLENVLQKYQITWLLVDNNVINPSSPLALFLPQLKEMIAKVPGIRKETQFGTIEVYKVTLRDNPSKFVFVSGQLPTVNTYKWGDLDNAYNNIQNYVSIPSATLPTYFYPFRSVFSGRTQKDKEFKMVQTNDFIEVHQTLPPMSTPMLLHIPSIVRNETIIPARILTKKNSAGNLVVSLSIQSPQVLVSGKKVWGKSIEQALFEVLPTSDYPLNLNVNGIVTFQIASSPKTIGNTFLTLTQDNVLVLSNKKTKNLRTVNIPSTFFQSISEFGLENVRIDPSSKIQPITIQIPKVTDLYINFDENPKDERIAKECENFNYFRRGGVASSLGKENGKTYLILSARNGATCTSFYIPNLIHEQGYAIFVEKRNVKGRGLHFWILNEDQKYSPIDTYFANDRQKSTDGYILSPQESFGRAYSLHFDNISIGDDDTINTLNAVSLYPIPYDFLTSLYLSKTPDIPSPTRHNAQITVYHPNESLYIVQNVGSNEDINKNDILVLSQSFNSGWKVYDIEDIPQNTIKRFIVYAFPFFFGKELTNHIRVNNWENGWSLTGTNLNPQTSTLIIVYFPQYLEYAGFFLAGLFLLAVITYLLHRQQL